MTDELIKRAEDTITSVYLACDASVADHISKTIQDLLTALKGKGWMPIESHDGSESPVLIGTETWSGEGYFNAERQEWYEKNNHHTDSWGGNIYPTHWQPLPTPPTSELDTQNQAKMNINEIR